MYELATLSSSTAKVKDKLCGIIQKELGIKVDPSTDIFKGFSERQGAKLIDAIKRYVRHAKGNVAGNGLSKLKGKNKEIAELIGEEGFAKLTGKFGGSKIYIPTIVLACDGAAWHKSKGLNIPKNIELVFIPPYTPEMNPIEQIWKEIRKIGFRNQIFPSLEKVIDRLCFTIQSISKEFIKSITLREWIFSIFLK